MRLREISSQNTLWATSLDQIGPKQFSFFSMDFSTSEFIISSVLMSTAYVIFFTIIGKCLSVIFKTPSTSVCPVTLLLGLFPIERMLWLL